MLRLILHPHLAALSTRRHLEIVNDPTAPDAANRAVPEVTDEVRAEQRE
jgi:hypothetical protein